MSDTPRTDAVMGSDVWTGDAETWARNLERESAAQAERIRELEADAERYRWWCENILTADSGTYIDPGMTKERMDAEIDKARKAALS